MSKRPVPVIRIIWYLSGKGTPDVAPMLKKADKVGAMYAANVGYNTVKEYDFWERITLITNDSRWTAFLSAHPYSQERAAAFLNSVTPV